MEQARLILAIALSFLVLLAWNFFFIDREAVQQQPNTETANVRETPPEASPAPAESTTSPTVAQETAPPTPQPPPSAPARKITVDTPLYQVELSERGAVFKGYVLKKYRETPEKDAPLKHLIAPDLPTGTLMTGFTGGGMPDLSDVTFAADATADQFSVRDAPDTISFRYVSPQGIGFIKRYTFSPDSYLIKLDILVRNDSAQPVQGNLSVSLANQMAEGSARYSFEGPSALVNGSLEQVQIKKIEDNNQFTGTIGWIAIENQYFMGSVIPHMDSESRVRLSREPEDIVMNTIATPTGEIARQTGKEFHFDLFFGPKSLSLLGQYENGLDRVIHFGMFDFIAKPCLWLMNFVYSYIPNYGIAIIILTIITKLLLWPLGQKSYKSMNEMRRLQPLMAEIREKHKGDKRKMNEELMNLYKIYKVNPMSGCLPMVLQIPVFFALYRMLYQAIELRHAPFFGWINDLSAPDRLFRFDFAIPMMEPPYGIPVLTIVMGATMFLQQKMTPTTGDPAQAKMMMFMPIVFTVIFINFSSGLVLYWLVNNILSISQQYYTQKKSA